MMMGLFVFLQNVSAAQSEPSVVTAVCENSFLNRSKEPNSSSIAFPIVLDGFSPPPFPDADS